MSALHFKWKWEENNSFSIYVVKFDAWPNPWPYAVRHAICNWCARGWLLSLRKHLDLFDKRRTDVQQRIAIYYVPANGGECVAAAASGGGDSGVGGGGDNNDGGVDVGGGDMAMVWWCGVVFLVRDFIKYESHTLLYLQSSLPAFFTHIVLHHCRQQQQQQRWRHTTRMGMRLMLRTSLLYINLCWSGDWVCVWVRYNIIDYMTLSFTPICDR